MKRYAVRVKGTRPLLMHRFGTAAQAELGGKVSKTKSGPPAATDEAEAGAYRLDPTGDSPVWGDGAPSSLKGTRKGQLCLPGEHFFASVVAAASGFQVKGKGKKTFKDAVKGNVGVDPEYVGLVDSAGKPLYDYEIDTRPARIGKARVSRSRPCLTEWVAEFEIVVNDDDAVPVEVLNAILVSAGQTKGVGDYRPRFGCFMVEEFKEVVG